MTDVSKAEVQGFHSWDKVNDRLYEVNFGVINKDVVDVYRVASKQSERVTQSLFNQPVEILQEKDGWIKVKVVDGYIGWILSDCINRNYSSIVSKNFKSRIVITGRSKKIYSSFKASDVIAQAVTGTELYCKNKYEDWYEVALPGDNAGWVHNGDVIEVEAGANLPKRSVGEFMTVLNRFMDTNYLWGGVSIYGIDCSGLTYICSRINGVHLPRDAEPQFLYLKNNISIHKIQPGDLVFFSSGEDLSDVSHVGVYVGNDRFLHASKSVGKVIISSIKSEYFQKRFMGARRIL